MITPLYEIILYAALGFYLGVFLREYANLKFSIIVYPFTFLLDRLKKLTNKEETSKDAKNEKEK